MIEKFMNISESNHDVPKNKTTIIKAREKCNNLGSSIKTFDLNNEIPVSLSMWTGTTRYNQ